MSLPTNYVVKGKRRGTLDTMSGEIWSWQEPTKTNNAKGQFWEELGKLIVTNLAPYLEGKLCDQDKQAIVPAYSWHDIKMIGTEGSVRDNHILPHEFPIAIDSYIRRLRSKEKTEEAERVKLLIINTYNLAMNLDFNATAAQSSRSTLPNTKPSKKPQKGLV